MSKTCFILVIIVLTSLLVVNSIYNMSAVAVKMYEYKEGDRYRFIVEMSSSVDTEEGKTFSTISDEIIVNIASIDEDDDGYDIKIEVFVISSGYGNFLGIYSYSEPISELIIEGNTLLSEGIYPGMFNLFTSTDWDDREDDWKYIIDEVDNQGGYRVTEESASNGVFTLHAEITVSDDDSDMDYDNDGDKDGYTGWFSMKGEYNDNGVLKSSNIETYIEFNKNNHITYSNIVYSGGRPLISSERFLYIGTSLAVFIVTFILGFFVGKHRRIPTVGNTPLSEPRTTTKHCINCGAEIPQDATFCIKCGKEKDK